MTGVVCKAKAFNCIIGRPVCSLCFFILEFLKRPFATFHKDVSVVIATGDFVL